MLTSQELTILLRDNGYKVTPQRIAVYEALAEDPCHPTAEVLYKKLQAKYPAMSFAMLVKTAIVMMQMWMNIIILYVPNVAVLQMCRLMMHCWSS